MKNTVFTGELVDSGYWSGSNEILKVRDFTSFETNGNYTIVVNDIYNSYDFQISNTVYNDDKNYCDEFIWAASELFISTAEEQYRTYLDTTITILVFLHGFISNYKDLLNM